MHLTNSIYSAKPMLDVKENCTKLTRTLTSKTSEKGANTLWFTNHTKSTWDATDPKRYNDNFRKQVRLIRAFFKLKNVIVGHEVTTGDWLLYIFHGHNFRVKIEELHWDEVVKRKDYLTPRFTFVIRMELDRGNPKDQEKPFFYETMIMEFPDNYPDSAPFFRVKGWKYRVTSILGDNHEHHLYPGGWM